MAKKRQKSTAKPKKLSFDELTSMDDSSLLKMKLSSFDLKIEGSWLEPLIAKLYSELDKKHINFEPHIWISDDWFSPDGVSGFAIPFYLFHPKLIELERKMMGAAEGDSCQEAMKLMRHETGHAIDNAFRLRRNKRRQTIFGLTSKPYPKSYTPDPTSKNFVRHLEDNYAQAHPDEDWAETFSVWLTPMSRWKRVYAHWPAMDKLECLNSMMQKIQMKPVLNSCNNETDSLESLDITLAEYYRKKLAPEKRANAPLRKIFCSSSHPEVPKKTAIPAWKIIGRSEDKLARLVAKKSTLQHNRIKRELVEIKKACKRENLIHTGNLDSQLEQLTTLIIKKASGPRRINM